MVLGLGSAGRVSSVLLRALNGIEPKGRLGPTVFQAYTLHFQTRLLSALPPTFTSGFKELCATFLAPPPDQLDEAVEANINHTPSTWNSRDHARLWAHLHLLGLVERYETIIASVGYEYIEDYVLKTCTGEWGKPMLESLRIWMSEKVVPWLLHIYARGATTSKCPCLQLCSFDLTTSTCLTSAEEARAMLQGVGSRFDFHINKTLRDLRFVFCSIFQQNACKCSICTLLNRTREIFDIIIDYPDSMGALQDLRVSRSSSNLRIFWFSLPHRTACTAWTNAQISSDLCGNCESPFDLSNFHFRKTDDRTRNFKRLLHPGAETKLILQQYVSTIKCLRIIDPPGVLLYKVADPIRRYLRYDGASSFFTFINSKFLSLRDRPDTIRSIVANLVGDDEESGDSLIDEAEAVPIQQQNFDDYADPNWEPEPIDAGPGTLRC